MFDLEQESGTSSTDSQKQASVRVDHQQPLLLPSDLLSRLTSENKRALKMLLAERVISADQPIKRPSRRSKMRE